MLIRLLSVFCLLLSATVSQAADHELKAVKESPEGLSPAVTELLNAEGFQVTGAKGALVEIWLLKSVAVKAGFKPGIAQMYPLKPGQLVGAMRVAKGADVTDFRGQQMSPGTYTLRYGLQPMDGNHVGTSDTSDFLLALPGKTDTKTADIATFEELSQISAKAAGSAHPAIFSLLDPKAAAEAAKLEKVGGDHWVLSVTASGAEGDKKVPFKLRLIVIGQTAG